MFPLVLKRKTLGVVRKKIKSQIQFVEEKLKIGFYFPKKFSENCSFCYFPFYGTKETFTNYKDQNTISVCFKMYKMTQKNKNRRLNMVN